MTAGETMAVAANKSANMPITHAISMFLLLIFDINHVLSPKYKTIFPCYIQIESRSFTIDFS